MERRTANSDTDLLRLRGLEQVYIRQQSSRANANSYTVTTSEQQPVLRLEEVPCRVPGILVDAKVRAFRMNAYNKSLDQVFWLYRPRTFNRAGDRLEVFNNERMVAYVRNEVNLRPLFTVCSAAGHPRYTLRGDVTKNRFLIKQVTYPSETIDNRGSINKMFAGIMLELFTSRDNYSVRFPPQCSQEYKAAIIGACILIDYKYHED